MPENQIASDLKTDVAPTSPTSYLTMTAYVNYQRRGKSKLVSNGALQHLRMLGNSPGAIDASSKRVAFSRTGVGLALSSIASERR